MNSYIWCFLFKKEFKEIAHCKEVCDQFLENLNFIFPYIFCNFDTVKLQKMYGKIYILGTT